MVADSSVILVLKRVLLRKTPALGEPNYSKGIEWSHSVILSKKISMTPFFRHLTLSGGVQGGAKSKKLQN